ncbi:MAG: bifunctional riboflavin kinase/FAD synthetase [Rhodoluna sp.]|nr:bifunctional riboflavin kinase/FAD synthetase [Rhodoluna sp.]
MITWTSIAQIDADFPETAVTIGKFDGVHLGHQALLADLIEISEEHGIASVVVTFDRHPDALLNPDALKQAITGPIQKQFLIREAGADALLTLTFDEALANLSPEEFVKKVLVDGLKARWVLVGADFRFGSKGSGNVDALIALGQKFGFRVTVVQPVVVDGEVVSTTLVREVLDRGDIAKAAELLGRPHLTTGIIEHGLKIGRTIGFPTANMSREAEGYLPVDGVYAGWLYADNERYPTALSVGINETFQAVPRLIEAHVIDHKDLDLYDKVVSLEYVQYVRPAAKFDGVDSLVAEINRDLEKCRIILGSKE